MAQQHVGATADQNFSATRKRPFRGRRVKGYEFKGRANKKDSGLHQSLAVAIPSIKGK